MRRCLALATTAAACAVGPDFVRPKPPPVNSYLPAGDPAGTEKAEGSSQRFVPGSTVPAEWWHLFGSSDLDALMTEAMAANQTLEAARASLKRSEDSLRAGYGIFFPQIDVGAGAERERFSAAAFGSAIKGATFNLFTLSSSVSYSLDIFGGERRTIENLKAQVDLQRYLLAEAWLTLSGNVVNTVVAEAGYGAQIAATRELISAMKGQVELTEAQFQAGTTPYSSVVSVQAQLFAIQATLPPLQERVDQADDLLATLAGRAPAERQASTVPLDGLKLPADLPLTLPSALVGQRPDILAAEAQLHGSSAGIGIATAAMLPSITLSADAGLEGLTVAKLFGPTAPIWAFGAGLTAPIFRGGTLWYQRKAAIDAWEQSLASYRQTVLGAFEQVADTLRALQHDADLVEAQSQALDAAALALKLVQANYEAGLVNYLQVLTADTQYQQAKLGEIQARAQRLQDTVALFVALGGGWRELKTLSKH